MFTKGWLRDWFSFTRKDRVFALVVVVIVASSLFLPRLLSPRPQPLPLRNDTTLLSALDTLQEKQAGRSSYQRHDNSPSSFEPSSSKSFTRGELFEFDPNTVSAQDWQRLGLNERTSKTIVKYVSRGGKFYRAEDLRKIWGLPAGFYERVKDYVVITSVTRTNYPRYTGSRPGFEPGPRKPVIININEADTMAFIALPGIGSRLSARIISFREKLGGFYSVDQIGETYGLPDSTFQLIKGRLQVDDNAIRKLNMNTATKEELKAHPYIRWNLANAIVEYRNQHGAFKKLEELKNIALVDDATYGKISHYLSF